MSKSDEYKEWIAGVFDRSSASYDRVGPRSFTYFGRGLVEFSGLESGARVLDVACGRGAVLIAASESVGERGEVVGIDISGGMITRLEKDLKRWGLSKATAIQMDAEDLQFPGLSFDYVLCGLALFFFPNPEVALNECFRVLTSRGYLVVSTVVAVKTPWREDLAKVMSSYRGKLASAPIVDTKDLDREEEVKEELETTGFVDIEHTVDTHRFFYRDEEEWWDTQWSIFRRGFMERLDPDSLKKYQLEPMEIVRECQTDMGIPTTVSVRYSRARKPAAAMQTS